MWDATTYLKEARDAHGRWISGAAALGSAITDLQKSGVIDKSTAEAVASAIARHSDMGRGLPKDAEHDQAKTLAYLAQTVRHDSLTYRHQSTPDMSEAKKLNNAANAIETAHAQLSSDKVDPQADSAFRLTPDSQPLDGPHGPMKIKGFVKENVTNLKHGDMVRVTGKDGVTRVRTVYRAAPNNDKSKTVVRFKDKVDGQPNSMSFDHDVKLSTVGYDDSHKNAATPEPVSAPDTAPNVKEFPVGSQLYQYNGATQIRQVKVIGHNDDGSVQVRALNGPLAGSEYDTKPENLREPQPKVVMKASELHADTPKVVGTHADSAPTVNASTEQLKPGDLRAQQSVVQLSADAREALHQYTGTSVNSKTDWDMYNVNRRLRNNKLKANHKQGVKAMDEAFESMPPTKKPMTLWRGIGKGVLPKNLEIGHVIADKGYMSTSTSSHVPDEFVGKQGGDKLKLTLPAGAHPIDMNAHIKNSQFKSEREVLIPRGAQIKVTNIKPNVGGKGRLIEGELVLPDLPGNTAPGDTQTHPDTTPIDTPKVENALNAPEPVKEPEPALAPEPHVEAPQTLTPQATAITTHDKPKLRTVDELKRGNMVEVNTSHGKVIRTLNRSPKKSSTGKLVLEFSDDKTDQGLKKNLSYEPGAHVIVVGQDDSYKNGPKVVYSASNPSVVQKAAEPVVVHPASEKPPVVKKAESIAEQTSDVGAPKVKFAVNTPVVKQKAVSIVKKADTRKISAEQLQVGDILDAGAARVPTGNMKTVTKVKYGHKYSKQVPDYKRVKIQRRVTDIGRDDNGNVTYELSEPVDDELRAHIAHGDAQQYNPSGYYSYSKWPAMTSGTEVRQSGPKDVISVTRLFDTKVAAGGKKVKLDQHPDAVTIRGALQSALDSGDDLSDFNPEHRNLTLPAGQSVGHVQSLLYDLAQGQRNGVGSENVKTDAQYMKDLKDSGEGKRIVSQAVDNTPYTFPRPIPPDFKGYGYKPASVVSMPADSSDDDLARVYHVMNASRYEPAGEQRRAWALAYAVAHNGEEPTVQQYAKTLPDGGGYMEYLDKDSTNRSPVDTYVKNPRIAKVQDVAHDAMMAHIHAQRAMDNTVSRDFEIPKWGDVNMEPQTFDGPNGVNQRVSDLSKPQEIDDTPSIDARARSMAQGFPDESKQSENRIVAKFLLDMPHNNAQQFIADMMNDPSYTSEIANSIDKYKGPNQTVPANFENMLMANYAMNDWKDIDTMFHAMGEVKSKTRTVVNRDYVPSFYTAGLVNDGILYHRQGQPTAPKVGGQDIRDAIRRASLSSSLFSGDEDNATALANGTVPDVNNPPSLQSLIDTAQSANHISDGAKDYQAKLLAEYAKLKDTAGADQTPGEHETTATIAAGTSNAKMMKLMQNLGAVEARDDQSAAATRRALGVSNRGSWGHLVDGVKLVVPTGGVPLDDNEQLQQFGDSMRDMGEEGKYTQINSPSMPLIPPIDGAYYSSNESESAKERFDNATNIADKRAALDDFTKLQDAKVKNDPNAATENENLKAWSARAARALNEAETARKDAPGSLARRIEYTPQSQTPDVKKVGGLNAKIGRNQRGRISLIGYSPNEAAAKLRELGVIGDLESQIPADQIFRGPRRQGIVSPLLSDYVRGDAKPPTTDNLQQHGLTAQGVGSDAVKNLGDILRSGGLMGIQERQKRGIATDTTSQVGDIASGIDHVTFSTLGAGGAVSGAFKLVMKPHNLIRRDVIVSNRDFGAGEDRYSKYKDYRDNIEAKAGMSVGKTDLSTPLAPAARQAHLDDMNAGGGPTSSDEYDVAGQIGADDIHTVVAPDPQMIPQIKSLFEALKKEGVISRIPAIVSNTDLSKAVKGNFNPENDATADAAPESGPGSLTNVAAAFGMPTKEVTNV